VNNANDNRLSAIQAVARAAGSTWRIPLHEDVLSAGILAFCPKLPIAQMPQAGGSQLPIAIV